ncbi:MAG: hypothetical protein WBL63_23575 [Candidatus Acidiferrum sp.]
MKNLRAILFAFTVLLIATATQAQQTKVLATVPFAFVVGDRAYPAGEYFLKSLENHEAVVRIDNTQEATATTILSHSCTTITPSAKTKLVFRRMGGNYFLYQVWVEGEHSGREFPRGRLEIQLAQNHLEPELVIVAANLSH